MSYADVETEFREYFNLQPHATFKSINSDPHIAKQLELLYGHPDNVEIYPGIVVEEAKPPMKPGSGLCASYTTSRAVLSDAVALVRSDRFHTVDLTPQNLTNWGFHARSYDLDINHGCVFYKLILNAFPRHFSKNSVYAHYPLVVPDENRKILRDMSRDQLYDFSRPVGKAAPVIKPAEPVAAAALSDDSKFASLWTKRAGRLGAPKDVLSVTKPSGGKYAEIVLKEKEWREKSKEFYEGWLPKLWAEKQYELGGAQQLDVVGDVLNAAHVGYLTTVLGLPLTQSDANHGGEHHGTLSVLGEVFEHAFGNPAPNSFSSRLRDRIHKTVEALGLEYEKAGTTAAHDCVGKNAFAALAKEGGSIDAAAWQTILPESALILNSLSRLSAQACEIYLDDKDVRAAAASQSAEAVARELTRLGSSVTSIAKKATTDVDNTAQSGQVVVVNLGAAKNATVSDANTFSLKRDASSYSMKTYGPEIELAFEIAYICNTVLVKLLAGAKQIDRAPGPQGVIKKAKDDAGVVMYLNKEDSEFVPYPVGLMVRFAA
jgi:hypothetical protein